MLNISNIGQEYTASFDGVNKLNLKNTSAVKSELLPIITVANNNLTIDFKGIHFIDSAGFQVLVALLKTAELYNSNMDVMNVSDDLKELFDLLSLSDVFQIAAN